MRVRTMKQAKPSERPTVMLVRVGLEMGCRTQPVGIDDIKSSAVVFTVVVGAAGQVWGWLISIKLILLAAENKILCVHRR